MDSDRGKLFIGGISWETSEEKLKDYFGNYGQVLQAVVMKDKMTSKPRGFGFVVFSDPDSLDRVLQDTHVLDGRTVEAKRALSREEQQVSKSVNPSSGRNFGGGGGNNRTKKIFVGGLPPTLSEDGFRDYFETFGIVTDVVIMIDQLTTRPRGFGFISFDSEDAVDRVLHKTFHDLNGKQVEVKRALPKDVNLGGSGRSIGGGDGYRSGGYGGGGSDKKFGSHDSGSDSNRYVQSQNLGGGYQAYGSSGGYGYGPMNNGLGYGGYGYGGGIAGVAYGGLNVASGAYGGVPLGAPRGYGNMGFGTIPGGGAATGHSPSGVGVGVGGGYVGQGYGYGYGYGGYANGNGAVELQLASGGGYMGGGYGDTNGSQGWRVDTSSGAHGGQGGYAGGAYGGGGAPARQTKQQ